MRPDTCHARGADLVLPCLASLLELQDVASLGSEMSGLGCGEGCSRPKSDFYWLLARFDTVLFFLSLRRLDDFL